MQYGSKSGSEKITFQAVEKFIKSGRYGKIRVTEQTYN